jgi:hypothetical protein
VAPSCAGGSQLLFDEDREHHWIGFIEKPLAAFAKIPAAPYLATAAIIGGLSFTLDAAGQRTFLIAGFSGVAVYFLVQKFGDFMGGEEDAATGKIVRSGAAAFVYLEFLDASFSFDGVIGAFAITNDILLIALGLGIGAMFVRSMTVALVKGGHLSEFRFLEPGAFYAIVALAVIMLISIRVHTPEVVTGLIGALIIGLSLWASIRHKKLFPNEYEEDGEADAILPTGDVVPGTHTMIHAAALPEPSFSSGSAGVPAGAHATSTTGYCHKSKGPMPWQFLSKGGNVSLSKEDPGLDEIMVGLGWDARSTDGQDFDLDASAFLLKTDGKVRSDADFCFYNNMNVAAGLSCTKATTAPAPVMATTNRSRSRFPSCRLT